MIICSIISIIIGIVIGFIIGIIIGFNGAINCMNEDEIADKSMYNIRSYRNTKEI